MRIATEHAILPVSSDEGWDFLSRIENLPRWATEFARECEFEGDAALVETRKGTVRCRHDADERTGVIDFLVGPDEASAGRIPARVVPLGPDRCLFLFTLIQAPAMTDAEFESDHASLKRELADLPALLEGTGRT